MRNISILLSIYSIILLTGCASTCMEYRSATTAARSEKNLQRAEEWGIKALESPECDPVNDARAPYFLATEVYLKQKNYTKMAEMLDIAEDRNSDQLLERPFKLGETPVTTIGEGVLAYRDQEWEIIFTVAATFFSDGNLTVANEKIDLAVIINPNKAENYMMLGLINLFNKEYDIAFNYADKGILIDSTISKLFNIKADVYYNSGDFELAEVNYLKAIELSDTPGLIKLQLLNTYIELGKNEIAIDFAEELINQYPNDSDIYYNVGVVYQRMAKEIQARSISKFNDLNQMDKPPEVLISQVYAEFREVRKYAHNAKDYFYEASDLEQDENLDTKHAISEMKLAMNQMDDIFIPSIRKIAKTAGVVLD